MLSLPECLLPLSRESQLKQSSFFNTNVLLKAISMACARARSCQTSHAINAALSVANSPSHGLLTPGAGRWELDRAFKPVLPSESPICLLPAPLLLPAAWMCRWTHPKGSFTLLTANHPKSFLQRCSPRALQGCYLLPGSPRVPIPPSMGSPCEPQGHRTCTCVF